MLNYLSELQRVEPICEVLQLNGVTSVVFGSPFAVFQWLYIIFWIRKKLNSHLYKNQQKERKKEKERLCFINCALFKNTNLKF